MATHFNGERLPEYDLYRPSTTDAMRSLTFWNDIMRDPRVDGRASIQDDTPSKLLEAVSNRYDNGVLQVDALLERLFGVLDQKGYLKNSIVVITGDHGEGLGEHGHLSHTRYLYQEDIRIPLLIYDSDRARYENQRFATQIDIAPTILHRLGLPRPAGWKGHSLVDPPAARITLHQTLRGNPPCVAAVSYGDNSLIKYIQCGKTHEAYDLVADPGEKVNLAIGSITEPFQRLRRHVASELGSGRKR